MEKRFYIGLTILLVLLVLGSATTGIMQAVHQPVEQGLAQAAQYALAGDMAQALPLAQNAYNRWQKFHSVTASFADHNPMDDTDTLFQEMLVYGKTGEVPHFVACCRELVILTQAMYDAHAFSLKNLL